MARAILPVKIFYCQTTVLIFFERPEVRIQKAPPVVAGYRVASDFWLMISLVAKVVGLVRVELTTSPLSGVRSSQLSYRPFGAQRYNWWS